MYYYGIIWDYMVISHQGVFNGDLMEFNGDLMGFNGDFMGFNGDLMRQVNHGKQMDYPLVNVYITMEKHHVNG